MKPTTCWLAWQHACPAAAVAAATRACPPCSAMPRLHVHAILCRRLEREDVIVARFVIGHSADARKQAAVDAEAAKHGDMLRLDLVEGYAGLPAKTIAFLRVGGMQGGDMHCCCRRCCSCCCSAAPATAATTAAAAAAALLRYCRGVLPFLHMLRPFNAAGMQ